MTNGSGADCTELNVDNVNVRFCCIKYRIASDLDAAVLFLSTVPYPVSTRSHLIDMGAPSSSYAIMYVKINTEYVHK